MVELQRAEAGVISAERTGAPGLADEDLLDAPPAVDTASTTHSAHR